MIDMHRKKTGVHDIRETELNIILAIDDNKAEDHEFGNSRREYFRLKDSLYACLEELSQTISELESEIENTEMLSGRQAVNEEAIKETRNRLMVLKKQYSMIENPELVMEEFRWQEAKIPEINEKKQALEKEVFRLERQVQEGVEDVNTMNTRLKSISSEIAKKTPLKKKLQEDLGEIEKSARALIERDELESRMKELDQLISARTDEIESVKNIVAECGELIPDLKKTLKSLQGKIGMLTRRAKELEQLIAEKKSLDSDIELLQAEFDEINAKVETLQIESTEKEKLLSDLTTTNADMRYSINSIEKFLADSGRTVREISKEKEKLSDSDKLNEDSILKMEELFNLKMAADNDLSQMGEALQHIFSIIETAAEIKL